LALRRARYLLVDVDSAPAHVQYVFVCKAE